MSDPQLYPVLVELPGSIYCESSQFLRDRIADWLEHNHVDDDDYDSFYVREPQDPENGNWYTSALNSLRYVCYSFQDQRLAVLFKLTFG